MPMTFTAEQREDLKTCLSNLPPKTRPHSLKDLIARLADNIQQLLDRNYTIPEVHEVMNAQLETDFSLATFQTYFRDAVREREEAPKKKTGTRRSRPSRARTEDVTTMPDASAPAAANVPAAVPQDPLAQDAGALGLNDAPETPATAANHPVGIKADAKPDGVAEIRNTDGSVGSIATTNGPAVGGKTRSMFERTPLGRETAQEATYEKG